MTEWGRFEGLFLIFFAVYALLLAKGVLPRKPKDPEAQELWRQKFGGILTVVAPILIVYGALRVIGVLK